MTLKIDDLKAIVLRSYEDGYRGCLELKEDYADEMVKEIIQQIAKKISGDWKVYTVQELRKYPLGTIFEHSRLGKCWIDGTERIKTVSFEGGMTQHLLANDEPWNEQMRLTNLT